MRIPVRSESEALRLTVATAAAIGVSILLGWLTAPLVGVAVFVMITAGGAIAYLRAKNPDRHTVLRDAAREPHPDADRADMRRVLVVANATLGVDDLRARLTRSDGRRVEIDVLAPVLASRLHYNVSDIDSALVDARSRLDRSLAWAHAHGISARGEVGDPSPTTALEDELRAVGADEVIVVTHPRDGVTWQEHGEVDRLRRELDLPVAHVIVGSVPAAT
jgi:uncharacterized membrane protein